MSVKTKETGLMKYDAMCKIIAEVANLDEALEIRSQSDALALYMKEKGNNEENRLNCERITTRTERRIGELLLTMKKNTGTRGTDQRSLRERRSSKSTADTETKTLKELNITKDQSANWQKAAKIPEKEFETIIQTEVNPTTENILHRYYKPNIHIRSESDVVQFSLEKISKGLSDTMTHYRVLRRFIEDKGISDYDITPMSKIHLTNIAGHLRDLYSLLSVTDTRQLVKKENQ